MAFGIPTETFNVLVGAGIALFSSGFLNWNQRRVERDRFRRTLVFEATYIRDAMQEFLDEASERLEVGDVEEALVSFSPDLLDADPSRMKTLTTSEILTVYEFYEAARLVKLELNRHADDDVDDPEKLFRQARRTVRLSNEVLDTVQRSRLSKLTEWYKDIESGRHRGG